jgi:micrococcal nuclease
LRVDQNGQKLTIRLGCIDAPEMKQNPYGAASRKQLQTFLPVGSTIFLREIDRDRYGRTVAEVYQGDQSINLAMVKSGQAVIYRQFFEGCKATQNQFNQAEIQAKQNKLVQHGRSPDPLKIGVMQCSPNYEALLGFPDGTELLPPCIRFLESS